MQAVRSRLNHKLGHICKNIIFRNKTQLSVGTRECVKRKFTQEDVNRFAEVINDFNLIHTSPEYARSTEAFTETVVHSTLLVGLIAEIVGSKFPGPGSMVISHHLKFPSPLYVGRTVHAEVTITSINDKYIDCAVECKDISSSDGLKVMFGKTTLLYLAPDAKS